MENNYILNEEEIKAQALQLITDDDIFCNLIEELDSWNGFADGFRCFPMYELDDFYCGKKVTDFLNDIVKDSFDFLDEYFYFSVYGLESTDDRAILYHDNVDTDDLLDEVIKNYNKLNVNYISTELDELLQIINEV